MTNDENKLSWEDLIIEHGEEPLFESLTCKIFNDKSEYPGDPHKLCPCDRLVRRHSFTDECLYSKAIAEKNQTWEHPTEFKDLAHHVKIPINVYGILQPTGCKFLRISNRVNEKQLFRLVLDDCGSKKPVLILSVYGGAKYFTMTERLEKEFIRGVIDAATLAEAWILTAGINNGVSKLVGEGIAHNRLLRSYSNKVKCIGLTMWGTINEDSRLEMKKASKKYLPGLCQRQIPDSIREDKASIEPNHTHCILLDGARLNEYLSDAQRDQFVTQACLNEKGDHPCYAVTIIVEGGTGSLEVLENDMKKDRPIVLIQGSGRLADVLATLIEQTSNTDRNQYWDPSTEDVEQAFDRFFFGSSNSDVSLYIKRIGNILKKERRHLLHVFSLDRDKNVAETIFQAIFTAKNNKKKIEVNKNDKNQQLEQEKQRRNDEDKLVDLALKWNYFDGVLPILQARQDEMVKKKSVFIEADVERQKELFRKSLELNRPEFIEYFLSAGFDPLTLVDEQSVQNYYAIICDLFKKSHLALDTTHKKRVESLFETPDIGSIEKLDHKINQLIGSFFGLIYSQNHHSMLDRMPIDLSTRGCSCCKLSQDDVEAKRHQLNETPNTTKNSYTKHQMLRDLFLWSIFMDMPEMSKVLLLHIRSRICAALIASALFKNYSRLSQAVDIQDKFRIQSLEFETYAARSIDKCYEYNGKRACELLLRQNPLFGDVTCMQVAISSESGKLLETACFDQTLNQVWFSKLSLVNHQAAQKVLQIPSVFTLGLIAPWAITYREEEEENEFLLDGIKDKNLSSEGINYYMNQKNATEEKWTTYWTRFIYFHQSPLVKMVYHFISYILFLLIFSYMMLYHLDGRNTFTIPHWTEIYVIITVLTMFCEEARKLYHEYKTRMTERWGSTGSSLLTLLSNIFYILPYFLFYLGLAFRYQSYNAGLLSTARIIWALDLELWYLQSLKFVIALKFLGPKLFMLKNMLRDLFAFLYMIFIAIAAYGVVSRSLILYNQVPFTGRGIFSEIFYEPYWFIYGTVSDKDLLDGLISNGTDAEAAEATATHVILAFHMLFINILLLNLLIAVFADTIGKVQENTEFYWRYQRYSFVREYFERLPLSYPPLIVIPHLALFFLTLYQKCCPKLGQNRVRDRNDTSASKRIPPIFKMIPMKDSVTEQWDAFENAATHSYARSVIERQKNKASSSADGVQSIKAMSSNDSRKTTTTDAQVTTAADDFKDELRKGVLNEIQRGLEQNNSIIDSRLDQMNISIEWIITAMARVKMNDPTKPRPTFNDSATPK